MMRFYRFYHILRGAAILMCVHSLYQDIVGMDGYIQYVRTHWRSADTSVPVAIIGLLVAVFFRPLEPKSAPGAKAKMDVNQARFIAQQIVVDASNDRGEVVDLNSGLGWIRLTDKFTDALVKTSDAYGKEGKS